MRTFRNQRPRFYPLHVRTLDALHLAAAERAGAGALPFLTYDVRQAHAARSLGWTVLGR